MIEDFVPVSPGRALITAGADFRRLNFILEVDYRFADREIVIFNPTKLIEGKYLRLGHRDARGLVYTDGWEGPHQPFRTPDTLYYADGAPNARIYRDGVLFIDHPEGIAEIGKPWIDGDTIFFEGRDEQRAAPFGWSVYRADLDGRNVARVCDGANPCVYERKLYFGMWNGRAFDLARTDRPDRLPADPHLPAGRP